MDEKPEELQYAAEHVKKLRGWFDQPKTPSWEKQYEQYNQNRKKGFLERFMKKCMTAFIDLFMAPFDAYERLPKRLKSGWISFIFCFMASAFALLLFILIFPLEFPFLIYYILDEIIHPKRYPMYWINKRIKEKEKEHE